jgi:hypothetical protein
VFILPKLEQFEVKTFKGVQRVGPPCWSGCRLVGQSSGPMPKMNKLTQKVVGLTHKKSGYKMGRSSGSLGWPTKPAPLISALIFCLKPSRLCGSGGVVTGEAAMPPHRSPSCFAALFQYLHRWTSASLVLLHAPMALAYSCRSPCHAVVCSTDLLFGKNVPVPLPTLPPCIYLWLL